jgi:hypothetical protein
LWLAPFLLPYAFLPEKSGKSRAVFSGSHLPKSSISSKHNPYYSAHATKRPADLLSLPAASAELNLARIAKSGYHLGIINVHTFYLNFLNNL